MEIKLSIEGIKCEGCIERIKRGIKDIRGIESFSLTLEDKVLIIKVKSKKILDRVINNINDLGFLVEQVN